MDAHIGARDECPTIHPLLPTPPFFIGIVAATESGKTTLIVNLLARENAYKRYFDDVNIVSPTVFVDPTWTRVDIQNGRKFDRWDHETERYFMDLMQKQRDDAAQGVQYRRRILNIFDDIVGEKVGSSPIIQKLATTYRWCNMSVILSTQRFRELTPVIRTNVTDWIIYNIQNGAELRKVMDEVRGTMSLRAFTTLYRRAIQDKYGFMHVSRRSPPESCYRQGFHTILVPLLD